jgi:hypothetical protein
MAKRGCGPAMRHAASQLRLNFAGAPPKKPHASTEILGRTALPEAE